MHVYFESHNPDGDQLQEWAVRRANSATRRLLNAVSRVKVQLSDAHGSSGLANKHCRIEFTIGNTGAVVATARSTDWRSALDWALVRAARALPSLQRRNRKRLRPKALTHEL
jgi:hypothetical protein